MTSRRGAVLARRLARAGVNVALSGRDAIRARRAFRRLASLPAGVRRRATRVRATALLRSVPRGRGLDLRRLLARDVGTAGLSASSRAVAVPLLRALVERVVEADALQEAPPAVAVLRQFERLELLCENREERAAAISDAAAAASKLGGRHAVLLRAAAAPLRAEPPGERPEGCPEPLPPVPGPLLSFGAFGTAARGSSTARRTWRSGRAACSSPIKAELARAALHVERPIPRAVGRPSPSRTPRRSPASSSRPVGVAADGAGDVYVSDFRADRVQKFTPDGRFLLAWGATGTGDGEFQRVGGLTVSPDGFVSVVDPGNGRIQKFTTDGAFVAWFGTSGTAPGQLSTPRGITTDGAGTVFVADRNEGQVKSFAPDGRFLAEWGTRGLGDGQFNGLYDVAFDPAGNLWTADLYSYRLQKFTPGGQLLAIEHRFGARPDDFNPFAVTVNADFNVYITNILGGTGDRILIFSTAVTDAWLPSVPQGVLAGVLPGGGDLEVAAAASIR